ncbi:MAG: hypothetical protein ACRDNO_18350 [Trebonia sp.]
MARALVAAAWVAAGVAAFTVYLRLAETRAVNSDGASQALQAWGMLHGNPLLRGWTVSDVSFYTTELPEYALVELIRGLRADVVDIAAAMTYSLVVLLAALVAKGNARGRQALVRVAVAAGIMLAPQLGQGTNVLLSSPDHIGTSVPLLLTWLVLDRGGRRWYVPVITSLLLAWTEVADSIAVIAGIIPLALVCAGCAARAALERSGRDVRYELALAGGALAAAVAASWTLRAITAAGGFTVRPLSTRIAPPSEIFLHNLPVAGQCLLVLFGADTTGPPTARATFFLLLHFAGVALAAAGAWLAARRIRRGGDLVGRVLLAAIAVNLGAFLLTERVVDASSAREIAPVLPFAAALAARELSPALAWIRRQPASTVPGAAPRPVHACPPRLAGCLLIVTGIGYLGGLGLELTAPAAPPQGAALTTWLESHRLAGVGLGGYWQASVVTLTSGGTVAIRPVADAGGGIGEHPGEVDDAWFDRRHSAARFIVLSPGEPGYPGYADYRTVRAAWGAPARVYRVGQDTIWYWPTKNLLSTIRH